jgi:DNA-binding NarL/FixJ family response regulator
VIRVAVVDDQELVRSGFRLILDLAEGIEVVGEAGDGREAVRMTKELQPDVVLMDVRMPELDGIEATRQLQQAGVDARVLVLTTFDLDEYVFRAVRAGASGFLLKDAPREQLVTAVRTVARGEAMLAPAITRRLIERFLTRPTPGAAAPELSELSARELDVLRLLARGLSNAEIATELIIGEATAKTHVARIFAKLHLRDRAQAVVLAYECGLVEPGGAPTPPAGH